ncbi:hypothetical protein BDZ85DRAFT_261600 [Elsinoe ampelina]|uniref:Uncharacterized protein n=1 Tax=Elsinoe ampelina TaxID=302913 RepID=A0A6A6GCW4_9PEZI|nr:hypothetical protein BDZ85DRAFT_261600 [Elsinoe ampelina]
MRCCIFRGLDRGSESCCAASSTDTQVVFSFYSNHLHPFTPVYTTRGMQSVPLT